MTTRSPRPRRWLSGLLALALLLTVAACDSSTPADAPELDSPELEALVNDFATDLSLSAQAKNTLTSAVAKHTRKERAPGFLWHIAADLQPTLSDAQLDRIESFVTEARPRRDRMERRLHRIKDGLQRALQHLDLTDAQKDSIRAIRSAYQPQIRALRQARRSGEITPEAFRAQMRALRAKLRADISGVLTDEQRAELEAMRERWQERRADRRAQWQERRAEARAVRAEVLNLSADQEEALQTLRAEHRAQLQALRDQRQSGDLTPQQLIDALTDLRTEHRAALRDILSSTQYEIVMIHRALAIKAMQNRAAHRAHQRGAKQGPPRHRGMR